MTVGQLRKLLEGVDDDMMVVIPVTQEFDGMFYSPCAQDSGVSEGGGDEELSEEEFQEMILLDKIEMKEEFLLIPCGFFEEKDHSHILN